MVVFPIEVFAAKPAIPPKNAEQVPLDYCDELDFMKAFSESSATASGEISNGLRLTLL